MSIAEKNRALFNNLDAGAVLLRSSDSMPDSSLRYFTGLGRHFLSSNALILKPAKKPLLLKSVLEPKVSVSGLRALNIDRRKQFRKIVKSELKGVKKLGLNKPLYTLQAMRELKKITGKRKLVDVSKNISSLRAIKSGEEISRIAIACKIAEKAADAIPDIFRKGMTEKQLGLRIEVLLREKGDDVLPFPVIVASAKNSAFPHNVPAGKRISKGLLLLDFGACHKGYCSDITRVFSVGQPSRKQKELYAGVFATKQFSQSLVTPGAVYGDVFRKAEQFLKKRTGFKLIHGLGHGLGVDAHDFPTGFLSGNREKMQKNSVLTVEPGIYGKFGGIRIEDDIVVAKKDCRPLTNAPEELLTL